MPARPASPDDLPEPLPPLIVLVGDEELLVDRAVRAVCAAARRRWPEVTETELDGGQLDGGELHELLGPSLFGDARLVVVRAAQDLRKGAVEVLTPYLQTPTESVTIVLAHPGAAKGKALLDVARKARALEIGCAKLTRPAERIDFVRAEVRRGGGRIAPDAAEALVDAVGSDLRELAGIAAQLASDCGGPIDLDTVRAYRRGRADVKGWTIAEHVMAGDGRAAFESLRHALAFGVPHVLIADALSDGVRTLARVASAGRGDPNTLARTLGMPAWRIRKVHTQMRGWDEPGVRRAFGIVATLNADVKGAAADGGYALERGVRALLAARRGGR